MVFDYGSPGDIFYVILSGKVSVKTPMSDFEHQGILFNNCHDFFYFIESMKRNNPNGQNKVKFFATEEDFTIVEESEKSDLEWTDSDFSYSEKSEKIEVDKKSKLRFVERIRLKAGQSFGEIALIKQQSRSAKVTCVEDCCFLTISKEMFDKVIK